MIKLKDKILKDKKAPSGKDKILKKKKNPAVYIKKASGKDAGWTEVKVSKRGTITRAKSNPLATAPAENQQTILKNFIDKHSRVEYFDDRFYKIILPLDTHPDWLKNIPSNLIEVTVNGIEIFLTSVTTYLGKVINKEFLGRWRGDVGNRRADEIIDKALNKGSIIHNCIDRLCSGTDIIYQNLKTQNISNKEIKEYTKKTRRPVLLIHEQEQMIQVARFQKLINILKPEILSAEQTVFSLQHAYAGTLDQVWNLAGGSYNINSSRTKTDITGGLKIIDFKTGNNYDEAGTCLQLSAYYMAHHLKDQITGAIGVHLNSDNKTGVDGVKLYIYDIEQLKYYFEQFQTYQKIFNYSNPVRPKRFEIPLIISMSNKIKRNKKKQIN